MWTLTQMGIDTSNVTKDEPLGGMEWSHHDRQTWQTIAADEDMGAFQTPVGATIKVIAKTGGIGHIAIEPFEGEIELLQLWPAELPDHFVVVVDVVEQEVARAPHRVGCGGGSSERMAHGMKA